MNTFAPHATANPSDRLPSVGDNGVNPEQEENTLISGAKAEAA